MKTKLEMNASRNGSIIKLLYILIFIANNEKDERLLNALSFHQTNFDTVK